MADKTGQKAAAEDAVSQELLDTLADGGFQELPEGVRQARAVIADLDKQVEVLEHHLDRKDEIIDKLEEEVETRDEKIEEQQSTIGALQSAVSHAKRAQNTLCRDAQKRVSFRERPKQASHMQTYGNFVYCAYCQRHSTKDCHHWHRLGKKKPHRVIRYLFIVDGECQRVCSNCAYSGHFTKATKAQWKPFVKREKELRKEKAGVPAKKRRI